MEGAKKSMIYEQEEKEFLQKAKEMINRWLSWQEMEEDLFSMEEMKTFELILEMNSRDKINKVFALLDHEQLNKKIARYRLKKKERELYGVSLQDFQDMITILLSLPNKEEFFSLEEIQNLEEIQKLGCSPEIVKMLPLQDLQNLKRKVLTHGLEDTKKRMDKTIRFNEEQMKDQYDGIQELKEKMKELNETPALQGMLHKRIQQLEKSITLEETIIQIMKMTTRQHLAIGENLLTELNQRMQNNSK